MQEIDNIAEVKYTEYAQHLKKMRLERCWSQKQLAIKTGLTRRQIASYEADSEPPMCALMKIFKAFGIIIFK